MLPPTSSFAVLILLASFAACRSTPSEQVADPPRASASAAAPSVSTAPSATSPLTKLEGSRADLEDAAKEIAERGDETTKRAAAPILVRRIRALREPAYREELRPLVEQANALSNLKPTPEQFEAQLRAYQDELVVGLVKRAGKIGGPEIAAYLVELAGDEGASREVRQAAMDALDPLRPSLEASTIAAVDSAREALRNPPAGRISVGASSASEGTIANASAVIAGMAAGFRRCFNRGLQEDPNMKGTVRITVKVGKNGEVLAATPSGGGTLSKTVTDCVVERVKIATFSPPEGGGATLIIPLSMTP